MGASFIVIAAINVVTLAEAVKSAEQHQPQLTQARALSDAARARQGEAYSGFLPQMTANTSYQLTPFPNDTVYSFKTGMTIVNVNPQNPGAGSTPTYNLFRVGVGLSQLIWDFGQTLNRYRAAKDTAFAQVDTEEASYQTVLQNVRTAYFTARANKDLVAVARATLDNRQKHLDQIQGFVNVGTRPEIDLSQARADRANARVQLIQSENNYNTAKAQLNLAMGAEQGTDYDVADEVLPPVAAEDESTEVLLEQAVKNRPDIASLDRQYLAQEFTIKAVHAAFFPTLTAVANASDSVTESTNVWAATLGVQIANYQFFQGYLTVNTEREARANLAVIGGQRDQLRQQARLDVEQARLSVRAAKATLEAARDALANSSDRLRLAEGRYQAGVGNVIELSDAQVQQTTAAAQVVQSDYSLSTARAQLLRALGRR